MCFNSETHTVYSQSKLAKMMFAYELQDKVKAHNKQVKVFVCHPGASNTTLKRESASFLTRISWTFMVKIGLAQSAEKAHTPKSFVRRKKTLSSLPTMDQQDWWTSAAQ